MTGNDFVTTARTYLNTPFVPGGRAKGVGVDCAGLLICTARDLGLAVPDDPPFPNSDQFAELIAAIETCCDEVTNEAPGDVVVFRSRAILNHCGFDCGDGNFIHAYDAPWAGRVIEQGLDDNWRGRLVRRFRWRQ